MKTLLSSIVCISLICLTAEPAEPGCNWLLWFLVWAVVLISSGMLLSDRIRREEKDTDGQSKSDTTDAVKRT